MGVMDSRKKTPMDLAANNYIRELMIVSNPQTKFRPSEADMVGLAIDGNKSTIRKVLDLPKTDYYEPYEHAQPRKAVKSKPKIN